MAEIYRDEGGAGQGLAESVLGRPAQTVEEAFGVIGAAVQYMTGQTHTVAHDFRSSTEAPSENEQMTQGEQ